MPEFVKWEQEDREFKISINCKVSSRSGLHETPSERQTKTNEASKERIILNNLVGVNTFLFTFISQHQHGVQTQSMSM